MSKWLRIRGLHELDSLSREFRRSYCPDSIGAVDIEMIVECDLRMSIVPLRDLCQRTGNKAWLAGDGKTICVDVGVQRDHPEEYRMSIAHEVAHAELHLDMLPVPGFRSSEDFCRFHQGLTIWQINCIESEARQWAGRVLVPPSELRAVFRGELAAVVDIAGRDADSLAGRYLTEDLVAQHFGVSQPCAGVRVRHDRLWQEAKRRNWFGASKRKLIRRFG